jgi:phosphotransferase system enzyme I (PtsI)
MDENSLRPRPNASLPPDEERAPVGPLRGIAGSPGIAVATALVLETGTGHTPRRAIIAGEIELELARFVDAVEEAKAQLDAVNHQVSGTLSDEHRKVFDAYKAMLDDPMLGEAVAHEIRNKSRNAEWAVELAIGHLVRGFEKIDDAYLRERRHDVEFVGQQLQRALAATVPSSVGALRVASVPPPTPGGARRPIRKPTPPLGVRVASPTIVVARDLSPADTAAMVREPIVGFATAVGTRTSHTAIIARALEIPAVVGVPGLLDHVRTGDLVIVDGLRGEIFVRPAALDQQHARERAARHASRTHELRSKLREPTTLGCGTRVRLLANVELPSEALLAVEHGAEGIGLYRTEFLYIDRRDLPGEEEQFELYRSIARICAPRPVTLRTFDLGGDKIARSLPTPREENPALGVRAVRLALRERDLLKTQLRAIARAAAHGEVRVMIPMVASLAELREVRALLDTAIGELAAEGQAHARPPLGVMIEVPAAALTSDILAREAAFFSLGTNDLVQYAMAIDRSSQELAHLASPFDPSILRLIAMTVRAADAASIPVSVCGAMASDPLAAMLLVGMGLRDLSIEAAAIAEIKESLRRATLAECEALAREVLAAETAADVERIVAETFAPRLSDVLAAED